MKQAGRWLLFAAALSVLPSTALAQKPGGKPTTKPPAGAAGGAAGGAAAGGEAVDLDSDTPPKDTPPPPPGDTAPSGGICEIDPSACPMAADLKTEAKKVVKAEVYAVQQNPVLKYHRFEVRPFWGVTMNDQFVSHPGPGLDLNFYITNVLAIGINGNFYSGLNVDSDFNFQNRRATRVAVPLTEYSWAAALNFTYVPVYGKFAGFGSFIFSYDIYATGGVGALSTRPIAVIDPDNRTFDFKPKIAFNVGLGLRIFLTKWLAATSIRRSSSS
jgi:outer membrane beta-barrel protein